MFRHCQRGKRHRFRLINIYYRQFQSTSSSSISELNLTSLRIKSADDKLFLLHATFIYIYMYLHCRDMSRVKHDKSHLIKIITLILARQVSHDFYDLSLIQSIFNGFWIRPSLIDSLDEFWKIPVWLMNIQSLH